MVVPTATTRSALRQASIVSAGTEYRSLWITCSAGVRAVTGRKVSSPMARSTRTTVAPAARQASRSSVVKWSPAVGAAVERSPGARTAE